MAESRAQFKTGLFLISGAIIAGILRYSGVGVPVSNGPYGMGSGRGYWIGTAIALIIGLRMIAQASRDKAEADADHDNADLNTKTPLFTRLNNIQFSTRSVILGFFLFWLVIVVGLGVLVATYQK